MSNHQGEIPNWLSESYIEKVLQTSFKSDTLKVQSAKFAPGSAVGENYACKIYRIHVVYTDSNLGDGNVNIIAKLKPYAQLTEKFKEDIDFDCFENETRFYHSLQSKFKEVLQEKGMNVYDFSPKCYVADVTTSSLLLEDLKDRSMVLLSRFTSLNLQELTVAVEALAQFHGAGLLILKKYPELKNKFSNGLFEANLRGGMRKITFGFCEQLRDSADKIGLEEKYVQKLKVLRQEIEEGSLKLVEYKEGDIHVLNHGDGWHNNLMFHYTEGRADQVILFDFQTLHLNSFANDLQYTIFMSGGAEEIVNNIDMLIERYYNKLKIIAPDFEEVTLERVQNEFKSRYYFGFMIASVFRPFMLADPPVDIEAVIDGFNSPHSGFVNPKFKADMEILLPFFEENDIFT